MGGRPKISGCLIVRDEASFLEECLARLWKAVDEIVVVDTGSTDNTVNIAQRMGARVYHHQWKDDFAEARNVALGYATHPWIFVIDADEYIDESTLGLLDELASPKADAYFVDVVNFPDDDDNRTISHHVSIFRNRPDFRYSGAIHEAITPSIVRAGGSLAHLPIRVLHYGYDPDVRARKNKLDRNRAIILKQLRKQSNDPMLNYYMAQECSVASDFEGAVKYYRRALWAAWPRKASFAPAAAVRLVIALWHLSRWDEAYEVVEQYKPLYPDYTDLYYIEGVLSRALGNYARAERALLRAVALGDAEPSKFELVHVGFGSYRAWTQLGELYAEVGMHREAFAAWSAALKSNPRYHPAVQQLVRLALKYDSPSEVLQYLAGISDLAHEATVRAAWDAFFAVRAWDECDVLARRLNDKQRMLRMALVALGRKSSTEARRLLLQLSAEEDTREHAVIGAALLAADTGDPELLQPFMDVSRDVTGQSQTALDGVLRDLLAVLSSGTASPLVCRDESQIVVRRQVVWKLVQRAVELGLTTALDVLGQVLRQYGLSASERALKFGKILEQCGFWEAATEQYLRAGLDGVYDTGSLLRIARYALAAGEETKAVPLLERVIQEGAVGPVPYVLLARTLQKIGEVERAKEVLEKGLERHPYAILLSRAYEMLNRTGSVDEMSRDHETDQR